VKQSAIEWLSSTAASPPLSPDGAAARQGVVTSGAAQRQGLVTSGAAQRARQHRALHAAAGGGAAGGTASGGGAAAGGAAAGGERGASAAAALPAWQFWSERDGDRAVPLTIAVTLTLR